MVTGFNDGNIPQAALTYQEEQGRQSFEAGKLMFMRNWPYVYSLASTDGSSVVKDKFGVAPLPGVVGVNNGVGVSSLGGHNLGMSAYSKHKGTALDFMKFIESEEIQRFFVTQASNAPVMEKLYDDPDLNKQLPYLSTLKTSIQTAMPRPVTPYYPAVTKAIQDNSTDALKGSKSVDQALTDMGNAIKAASGS
ncbi:extracellular solute-binding protein [Propionibacterium sp.]|uniref:extracellular solute-binding protein n=1 Tax=Propionibacterium sp. TaxID=1977903 RepID=UPI0039ED5305